MAQEKVIFISHPVRGERYSATRRADLQNIGRIVDQLHKELRSAGFRKEAPLRPVVPYRLHGEVLKTQDQVVAYREGADCCDYDKLHLYGDALCEADIRRAQKRRVPIIPKTEETKNLFAALQALAA